MRIDLVLASAPVAGRVRARGSIAGPQGKGPSDHAPVIVDLDEAPDGDIGPVCRRRPRRPSSEARANCPSHRDRTRRRSGRVGLGAGEVGAEGVSGAGGDLVVVGDDAQLRYIEALAGEILRADEHGPLVGADELGVNVERAASG